MPIECPESFSRSPHNGSFFSPKRVTHTNTKEQSICCVAVPSAAQMLLQTCLRWFVVSPVVALCLGFLTQLHLLYSEDCRYLTFLLFNIDTKVWYHSQVETWDLCTFFACPAYCTWCDVIDFFTLLRLFHLQSGAVTQFLSFWLCTPLQLIWYKTKRTLDDVWLIDDVPELYRFCLANSNLLLLFWHLSNKSYILW